MSRIGTKTILIPSGVDATLTDNLFVAKGSKGEQSVVISPRVSVKIDGDTITVDRNGNDKLARSLHGLTRQLIQNAITGAAEGFTKKLEMHGIGYRAQTDGRSITLTVGFSHPVVIAAPEGITFSVEKKHPHFSAGFR